MGTDPIVLAPGAPLTAWFARVLEITKRSWRSALIIAVLGLAVPRAAVALISTLGGWGTGLSLSLFDDLGGALGVLLIGLLLTLAAAVAACFVAAAGWAAGTWALVREAATGRPASITAAFSYGFKRAGALFPWTLLAGVAFTIGMACFFVPGLYVAYGFCMFGFVALFERGANPVARSFRLTHDSAMLGPTLGKVGILFATYLVYTLVLGAIFRAISLVVAIGTGGFVYDLSIGLVNAAEALLSAPALAVLLLGLLPTYAELRARETPLSTDRLARELG